MKARAIMLLWLLIVMIFAPPIWAWNVIQVIFSPVRGLKGCRAWDITGATVLFGSTEKTISYKSAVAAKNGNLVAQDLCNILGDVMPGHCQLALTNQDFTIKSL